MGTQPQTAPAEASVPCVGRQPILNAKQEVLGYELSFQQSSTDRHQDVESEASVIIETLNVIGFGVLCDGRRAFIQCTHKMLMMEYFALLPPGVVFEIQPSVPANESIVALCRKLKQAECLIALDNFAPNDPREPLLPYADFIKIDIRKIPWDESSTLVRRYASEKRQMLAQEVETRQDLALAKKAGFVLFQGYFFRHTEHLRARHIPANRAIYLRLLQAVSKPNIDFGEIEDLIKHEPSLCYRLLRYLNSPLLGLSTPVLSIRHAFNLLGESEN